MGKLKFAMQMVGAISIGVLFWQNWIIALAVCGLIWAENFRHATRFHG